MKPTESTPFLDSCLRNFLFLEKNGFNTHACLPKDNKIVYENETTAIIISLDPREQSVSIYLGRKDRQLADGLDSWCYDLGDIVVPKNPSLEDEYQKVDLDWNRVLKRRAQDLKTYASEILSGDFSSFRLAQKDVDKRLMM